MKKTLALVLALAMVFSTVTVVFAEGEISAEAQVCADLGMLKGTTGTVDAAYTATTPTRIQAAVMFLRLKGLEEEALAFTGEDNFADADQAAWAKPIMAYLKANPQLGWVGDGTNFNPTGNVTAQMYYKVLLEALGYKQNTPEVVGDFTWENVLEFAASLGLGKVADVDSFTVNDLAVATVEALKTNVKGTEKTLVASLIEAGKVDEAKAVEAGLVEEKVTTTDAELDSVVAIANNKVEVKFTADVAKSFAEDADNYSIVVRGSSTALEVVSAVAESGNVVVLETAAQTGGTAYTLTVGGMSKNFSGIAKDSGAPSVDDVECVDTNTVKVTFNKTVDRESAIDIANYTLNNNATVKSAALNEDRDVVTLTTEGVQKNKSYKLKIENVKSSDLVAMKAVTKSFTGKVDNDPPKLDSVKVQDNNVRIKVYFDDEHGVDKASAETIENYVITDGTNEIAIESIKAKDSDSSDDIDYDYVEITTEPMEKGKQYTLKVNGIVDGSVSANVMPKEKSLKFRAKPADDDAPELDKAYFVNDDTMWVQFKEDNRLDPATAEDPNNYEINDLNVVSATILDKDSPDDDFGKVVLLKTSVCDDSKRYTLVVNNVADEFGNVIKADSKEKSIKGVLEDVTPPYIEKVRVKNSKEIVLKFADDPKDCGLLDRASAEDPTNYYIDGLAIKKAKLEDDFVSVKLTTAEMKDQTKYKIKINGVKDINGNVASDYTVTFYSTGGVDNEAPEIDNIDVLARNLVQVTFDEEVTFTLGTTVMTVDSDEDGVEDARLYAVGTTVEDGEAIIFKAIGTWDSTANNWTNNLWTFVDGKEYKIMNISDVYDKSGNVYKVPTDYDDKDTFEGEDNINEVPEVESIEQINARKVRVVFTEPVTLYNAEADYTVYYNKTLGSLSLAPKSANKDGEITLTGISFSAEVDPDDDKDDAGYSTVELTFSSPLKSDNVIGINFTDFVVDYAGAPAMDEEDDFDEDKMTADNDSRSSYLKGFDPKNGTEVTLLDTYFDEDEKPEIVEVRAKNNKTIEIVYEDDVDPSSLGSYKVVDEDDKKVSTDPPVVGDEDYIVELKLSGSAKLRADKVYTLTVVKTAKNWANNTNKDLNGEEYEFNGSSVEISNYITGVKQTNARTLKVYLSGKVASGNAVKVYKSDDKNYEIANTTTPNDDDFSIALDVALVDGVEYTVEVADFGKFEIEADVDDGGIDVDENGIVVFSEFDVNDYVVEVVYDYDNDGDLDRFYVIPTATEFDMSTLYLKGGATTIDKINFVDMGGSFVVEVYRVITEIPSVKFTESDYYNEYNGNIESAPIYVQELVLGD